MKIAPTLLLAATLSASLFITPAISAPVAPTGYSFDQVNACGSWCYFDSNFTKLTDGIVGNAGWAANQGSEWVGWVNTPVVNIDFNFSNSVNINSVSIGSTQDNLSDVVLPSFQVWAMEAGNWVMKGNLLIPASSANNNDPYNNFAPNAFYTLAGLNINSSQIRVSVLANGPWSFVDEVRFEGSPVPVPAAAWLLGSGLLGLIGVARRKAA